MVNVYEGKHPNTKVIARVQYTDNVDHKGLSLGKHRGLTRLKDGRYVLIHGSQWEGTEDIAHVVSDEEALQAILRSGNTDLFELKKFAELKKLRDKLLIEEMKEEEEE